MIHCFFASTLTVVMPRIPLTESISTSCTVGCLGSGIHLHTSASACRKRLVPSSLFGAGSNSLREARLALSTILATLFPPRLLAAVLVSFPLLTVALVSTFLLGTFDFGSRMQNSWAAWSFGPSPVLDGVFYINCRGRHLWPYGGPPVLLANMAAEMRNES